MPTVHFHSKQTGICNRHREYLRTGRFVFERISHCIGQTGYFVSTRDAFAAIKPQRPAVSLKEVIKQPVDTWKDNMQNDFEDSVFLKFPEIAAIKDELYDLGAVYASMSGSGSCVYGIFKEPIENVEDKFCQCFCRQRELE